MVCMVRCLAVFMGQGLLFMHPSFVSLSYTAFVLRTDELELVVVFDPGEYEDKGYTILHVTTAVCPRRRCHHCGQTRPCPAAAALLCMSGPP